MEFNNHSELEGKHAFLSASKHYWINYIDKNGNPDVDRMLLLYKNSMASIIGTIEHDYACRSIRLNRKQIKNKDTVNLYINDAIGYRMSTEQLLYYSDNCFGTADAICFRNNFLRIHDLKTGASPIKKPDQLYIYAALFCLEYSIKPENIKMEFRIYQSNEVSIYEGDPKEVRRIMDLIIIFDKEIELEKEKCNYYELIKMAPPEK